MTNAAAARDARAGKMADNFMANSVDEKVKTAETAEPVEPVKRVEAARATTARRPGAPE